MKAVLFYISIAILVCHSSFVYGLFGKQTSEANKIQTNVGTPCHVSIQNVKGKHLCSGAILNKEVIITVASCLKDLTTSDIKLVMSQSPDNHLSAKELKIHPRYQTSRKDYNIALIILDKELPSDQENAELPPKNFIPKEGNTGKYITYDRDQEKVETTDVFIGMPSKCKNNYAPAFIYITDRMFCAELHHRKTCKSDFGGLLLMDDKLVGVMAWEAECGSTRYPSIFTNIASYKKWIEEVL